MYLFCACSPPIYSLRISPLWINEKRVWVTAACVISVFGSNQFIWGLAAVELSLVADTCQRFNESFYFSLLFLAVNEGVHFSFSPFPWTKQLVLKLKCTLRVNMKSIDRVSAHKVALSWTELLKYDRLQWINTKIDAWKGWHLRSFVCECVVVGVRSSLFLWACVASLISVTHIRSPKHP